jgi:hypothetical protein
MYSNFEERGEDFKGIVRRVAEESGVDAADPIGVERP